MNFLLEVVCFSMQGCVAAQAAGAHRIELCDNESVGGTTPSYGFIKAARQKLSIPLYCMIRPRGGHFTYDEAELDIMKADILQCKLLGCDGVVLGILNKEGHVNTKHCAMLISHAYPMGVTFHRAFDGVADPEKSLEDIIELGCERILTSGGAATAAEGAATIADLINQADSRIIVMPGGSIRSDNIISIAEKTGATEFHSSAKIFLPNEQLSYKSAPLDASLNVGVNKVDVKSMLAKLSALHDV